MLNLRVHVCTYSLRPPVPHLSVLLIDRLISVTYSVIKAKYIQVKQIYFPTIELIALQGYEENVHETPICYTNKTFFFFLSFPYSIDDHTQLRSPSRAFSGNNEKTVHVH